MPTDPVIGIVGHGYAVPRPFGELPVAGTPQRFVDALVAAGTRPVVLPSRHAVELLDLVDGLVLTGGGDLDPAWYGGPAEMAREVDRERDVAEIELVKTAADLSIPLLGVCRGLQVLVVAFGGTLVSDLPHEIPFVGHPITAQPGSLVARLVGLERRTTALHRQAVSEPGGSWLATAWADDGIIEAVEWTAGGWPVLGVQWHPEHEWDTTGAAVFGWLREAAEDSRRSVGEKVAQEALRPL